MKRLLLLFFLATLILDFNSAFSQIGFQWININGGGRTNLGESVRSIQTDRWGNVYVAGRVNAIFYRDSLGRTVKMQSNPNLDSLLNYGGRDVWLAKYSKEGDLLWHRYAGGGNDDSYIDMIADPDGNCYIAGRTEYHPIRPTYDMGGNLLGISNLGTYIAKIDSGGNQIWHKTFGGDTASGGFFVPYPVGSIKLTFKSNKLIAHSEVGLHPTGFQKLYNRDSLLQGLHELTFDLQGNYLGVKSLPTPNPLRRPLPQKVVSNGNETFFAGIIDQDTLYIGNDTLFNEGVNNSFLISFDSTYNVNWIFQSDNEFDQFRDMAISGDSLIVAGLYLLFNNDTVAFDTINHVDANAFVGSALFIFSASSGRLKGFYPSKSIGFGPTINGYATTVNSNFMAIGGEFDYQMTFSNSTNYLSAINRNPFFSVFDRNGNFHLEDQISTSGFNGDEIRVMHLKDSMLYVGGTIADTARIAGVDTVISDGSFDAFVAAYRLSFTTSLEENNNYIKANNGILAYPNPTVSNTSLNLLGKAVGQDAILFNLSGKEIKSYRLDTNAFNQELRLGELKTGIYFLVIVGEKEKQSLKIVVN